MRLRILGIFLSVLITQVGCSQEQQRSEAWVVEETPHDYHNVELDPPDPIATEPPDSAELPDLPFSVEDDVVVHRHSLEDATSADTFVPLAAFLDEELYEEESIWITHSHSIDLEVPEGLPVFHKTGRAYVFVPGSVLQTPQTHVFEVLSEEYRDDDVNKYGGWRIETEAWGPIVVHAERYGLYIRSHPKSFVWEGGDRPSVETTYTQFNRPGSDGPVFNIQVWKSEKPTLTTYTLERGPNRWNSIDIGHTIGWKMVRVSGRFEAWCSAARITMARAHELA